MLLYFWTVKIVLIFYVVLLEGTTRVGHLYSAMLPLSSVFNFTLKVAYIQLTQQLIERIVQKNFSREKAVYHCWLQVSSIESTEN